MQVEALKTKDGLLIPIAGELSQIKNGKIFLEVKVIHTDNGQKKRSSSASDIFGILKHRKLSKPVSVEDMEAVIRERRGQ